MHLQVSKFAGIQLAAILASTFSAAPTNAATFEISSNFSVKTTYSSTGLPCETDCWEVWWSSDGLGQFMVVKDSLGYVQEAGRITEAYFADLFASVDEANRKIPISLRINRNGVVKSTLGGAPCSISCAITVDFGYTQDIVLVVNGAGKIGAAGELGDANPLAPSPQDNPPPGWTQCGTVRESCAVYLGRFGMPSGIIVSVWIEYDQYGNQTHKTRVSIVTGLVVTRVPVEP